MTISDNKRRIIHVARRQLGLSDEDYRSVLFNVSGVSSANDLDDYGFDAVMDRLNALGFKSMSPRKPFGNRAGMATDRQTAMIRALWGEFTDGKGDDKSLGKWLDAKFKVSSLRFLSAELAPKVVAALKAMLSNKTKASA